MKTKLLFASLIVSISLRSQVCFYPHTEYSVGSNTNTKAITSGDFNNDGKPDLAVAIVGPLPSVVSILLGDGTGGFGTASTYTCNTQPYAIVSTDFNNDGKADVAVANNGTFQGFSVMLGNGTGALGSATSYATTGTNPAGIATGDFNGDGKKDIAITNYNSTPGTVSVYFGNGNGTFGTASTYTVGTNPSGIVCADVTGDGIVDLVTANSGSNNVTVLWNTTGAGVFAVAGTFGTGASTAPKELVAIDLNGDGHLDLVTCNNSSANVSVLLNNGSGQYSTANTYPAGTSPLGITYADFDGDGNVDVAVANSSGNNVSVLRGLGGGVLSNVPINFATASTPVKLVSADFNGDGKKDIATANEGASSDNTSILLNSLPSHITVSGNAICSGNNSTLTASGTDNYQWMTGSTTSSIIVSPTTTTTYSVTGTNASCSITATGTKTVTVNPLPDVTANASATTLTLCTASSITLTGGGAVSYVWSGNITNGIGFIPTSTSTYTVTGTDANGCSNTNTVTVVLSPPSAPAICLATVDSLSKNNVIVWDKTPFAASVDTFIIYRDTANNNYAPIGKVPYDSLSMFTDTVRSLYAANGDPNASTWKYKIAVKDTCGNISAMSPYHKTLFIQNNSGNFTWNDYLIEGQTVPVPALSNYLFQRDNLSNGNYITIQTLSASSLSYTDAAYATYQSTATWRVLTKWSINCIAALINPKNPTLNSVNYNSSKSNIYRTAGTTSVNQLELESSVHVFPDPSNGVFNLQMSKFENVQIKIYNVYGESIHLQTCKSANEQIDLSSQQNGIYFMQLKTKYGTVNKKIIINK